ncbi:MAG TPA: hypothetical protein VEY71_12425, partial [Chitinophagales bacterium]|nr:hypothetical protein [Chitinophagales bacterium]
MTYLFYDTIAYSDSLALDLPFDDWQVVSVGNLSGSTFLPGDSAFRTIIIAHPVDSIPFYAQTIKFNSYGLIEGIASRPRVATTTANVYFTPYNTVEIWNSVEFANLQRYWFSDPGQYKTRVYVHPDSIPVTNIPDWFVPSERWQEDFQVAFVEGLGYAIPMLATHPDSLMDYIDSSRADGCGATYRRFQGTVSGNVFTIFQIPTGGAITALAGLKVEIWEHDDAFLSIKLAEGELDAQGNFSIWVNTCQSSIFEGSNCEIFLKIVAKNDQYDIKGFTSCWPWMPAKVHSTQLHSWPYNNGDPMNLNMGSEFVWEESHKAVYLARNAYRFFNDSYDGWDLPIHLNLQTDLPNGSFFLPNSYGGVPAATALYAMATQPYILPYMTLGCAVSGFNFNSVVYTPTIYVWDGETDGENLVYHEFGHFVMWHLNDKKWTDLFTGTFAAHDPYTESNIRIAWNEGWSDAFSMMVDAHHRNLDNEFAFWDAIDEMDYENREYTPGLDEDEQPIFVDDVNFGPGSEFFIACALYDLWDGPSKINNFPPDRYTDANDDQIAAPNRWRNGEFDDVELSFQEIANVIRYGTLDEALSNDVNVISSVQSYYYNLIKDKSCDDARRIKKVFDQNRVVGIRGNFPDADYEGFSSDGIWRTREIENSGGSSFDYFFKFDLNTLDNALPVYNLGSSTNNVEYANISDRMQINTGCSLYFNAVGAQFYADNNGTPDDEMLYVTVCNHVNNSGLMHVGHDANNAAHRNVAEVKFMAGGTLTLNAGSTLRVKPHSRVIFEPGSSFVYNGGTIVLEGSDSYIEIKGAFHIGDHATFTFTGDGHVILQTPYDSPSFTVGTNSKFVLDGADKNDLVLVTNGWMCAPPDALAEFKITNGKVECDYNGGLNLGCPCTVQNVLITRRSDIVGGGVHRGLNIYNQQTTGTSAANISSVEIEHGWRGFVAIPWDVIHEVSDVYVHDCEEALLTINAGITMTDVHLAHNRLGWQAFNMTLPSRATNLRIENTKEAGINYHGGGSSP